MAHLGSAVPAYGRDYKSSLEVYADFMKGKDFLFGMYERPANKESFFTMSPVGSINIRFKRLTQVVVLAWNQAGAVTVNGKKLTQAQLDKLGLVPTPS